MWDAVGSDIDSDYTESLAPNYVVVHGSWLKLSRDALTADHRQLIGLAVFCDLLSQAKPRTEKGLGDTADV